MQIRHGYSRIVFLVGKLAIKIPNFLNGDRAIVIGLSCNLHEYEVYRTCNNDPRLAKVYFRFPIALVLVMRRYKVLTRPLNETELQNIPLSQADPKVGNYADDNGCIVAIDYGNAGNWYIGGHKE